MSQLALQDMQRYLGQSITNLNSNKLNGLLAEVDFRNYLHLLGFSARVSPGGWIARSKGAGIFGHNTIVIFPETIIPYQNYAPGRTLTTPLIGLHTVCATFHQLGIHSYFCSPTIGTANQPSTVEWHFIQMGLPSAQSYVRFPFALSGFRPRTRRYNFLKYSTNVASIPHASVPEEFSKEHLRVTFQTNFMAEISDIDGIFWGHKNTYPIEIKEKTPDKAADVGEYFGLDLGPFVKLAYYVAKRGNLHSLYVVREIDDVNSRNLVDWWFIQFEHLAQYASWVLGRGGPGMLGGPSTVVRIPKNEFQRLDAQSLNAL